jgi:hypothetical protein
MPNVENHHQGMGTYSTVSDTQANAASNIDPANTVQTGQVVDSAATPAVQDPLSALVSGIGGIVLFPGRVIVQQFAGAGGDPLDMSHLPVTILLSAAAWYGLYWYFFARKDGGGGFATRKKRRVVRRHTASASSADEGDE